MPFITFVPYPYITSVPMIYLTSVLVHTEVAVSSSQFLDLRSAALRGSATKAGELNSRSALFQVFGASIRNTTMASFTNHIYIRNMP
jgi:hypothetical protein